MEKIKTNIFLLAMVAMSPLTANAQVTGDADTVAVAKEKKVHVAFRDKDPDHLLGGACWRMEWQQSLGHGQ